MCIVQAFIQLLDINSRHNDPSAQCWHWTLHIMRQLLLWARAAAHPATTRYTCHGNWATWIFRFRVLILFSLEQAEALESQKYLPAAITMDEVFFKECLIELLQDMFEEELVTKALAEDTVTVNVDNENAVVSLQNMTVNIWFFLPSDIRSRASNEFAKISQPPGPSPGWKRLG